MLKKEGQGRAGARGSRFRRLGRTEYHMERNIVLQGTPATLCCHVFRRVGYFLWSNYRTSFPLVDRAIPVVLVPVGLPSPSGRQECGGGMGGLRQEWRSVGWVPIFVWSGAGISALFSLRFALFCETIEVSLSSARSAL